MHLGKHNAQLFTQCLNNFTVNIQLYREWEYTEDIKLTAVSQRFMLHIGLSLCINRHLITLNCFSFRFYEYLMEHSNEIV